ncbi:indole-3-glycerol phosphate synthase TrpC [bacterium]|nr:MAG: indole-3-glycerol phosphate synthase TrpC [bacterium]
MTILDRIFATKRAEVAAAKAEISHVELRSKAADATPPRGFLRALMTPHRDLGLIAEVKKASPSKGLIRADFNPVEIALAYERAGADCLSVLTDREYFQGAPEYLTACRDATSLPVLRKDFIADSYQIAEARAWGADAVLLIVAGLEDAQIGDLYAEIHSFGMDALIEVHTEEEALRVVGMAPGLIGINNRDLATFETSLETTERIAPLVAPFALPVSESALRNRADLDRVKAAGARAVLIGETFTAAADIESKLREVMQGSA